MAGVERPEKPDGFPLFPHASGKWAKKVDKKLRYFGRWEDPEGALLEYQQFCQTRPTDRMSVDGLTVLDACNEYLTAKDNAVEQGELSRRSWQEYMRSCEWLRDFFGRDTLVESLGPDDFARYKEHVGKRRNIVGVGNEVTRAKSVFKWLYDARKIREPVYFGPDFKKPSAKSLRRHRRLQGKKLFTAEQIRLMLLECGTHMRAMVYLGINGAFGPADCATLPLTAVDLESGWIHYPRPKTEVERSVPLWPETAEALRHSLTARHSPGPECQGRFFVMRDGRPWDITSLPIAKRFRQVMGWAGLRKGGFYWLRHTFETVGGESKDQVAVNAIMGHVDGSMAAVYREEISETRLRDVTNRVRDWLLA